MSKQKLNPAVRGAPIQPMSDFFGPGHNDMRKGEEKTTRGAPVGQDKLVRPTGGGYWPGWNLKHTTRRGQREKKRKKGRKKKKKQRGSKVPRTGKKRREYRGSKQRPMVPIKRKGKKKKKGGKGSRGGTSGVLKRVNIRARAR